MKAHPVHAQIKYVRDHYLKLDNVVNRRKQKEAEKEEQATTAPITRIVERTVNENQRIIREQQNEIAKAKKKAKEESSSSSSESSSSESASESESEDVKVPVKTASKPGQDKPATEQKKP